MKKNIFTYEAVGWPNFAKFQYMGKCLYTPYPVLVPNLTGRYLIQSYADFVLDEQRKCGISRFPSNMLASDLGLTDLFEKEKSQQITFQELRYIVWKALFDRIDEFSINQVNDHREFCML